MVVGLGMIGLELDRPAMSLDRFVGPADLEEGDAQVVVSRGQAGRQLDRAAETGDGPFPLAGSPADLAQITVKLDDGRVDADRPADQLDRDLQAARLAGAQAHPVPCTGLVGVKGQDLAIDSLGLGQPAGLVMPDGDLQRLIDRDLRHRLK